MSARGLFWLSLLLHVVWWPLGIVSAFVAPMALMGFDTPGSAADPAVRLTVLSILSLPVVILGAEVVAIILQFCGFPRLTLMVQAVPFVPLAIVAGALLLR